MKVNGQLQALHTLPSGGRMPSTHWTLGGVGPTAGFDTVGK